MRGCSFEPDFRLSEAQNESRKSLGSARSACSRCSVYSRGSLQTRHFTALVHHPHPTSPPRLFTVATPRPHHADPLFRHSGPSLATANASASALASSASDHRHFSRLVTFPSHTAMYADEIPPAGAFQQGENQRTMSPFPATSPRHRSVREVARARHVHRDTSSLRSFDGFFVANRSARLNDCLHAGINQDLQAISEGEERI